MSQAFKYAHGSIHTIIPCSEWVQIRPSHAHFNSVDAQQKNHRNAESIAGGSEAIEETSATEEMGLQ